ncbi:MAG: PIN domain-containing protein [Verrucomicrobiae bacterium]|nr:PIN domain-containing protein [Verrucomicrobiae bacterium]
MKIFLDANILFSAAKSNGAIRFLIMSLLDKEHQLVINLFVQEEAERNLTAKAPEALEYFYDLILRLTIVPLTNYQLLPKKASFLPLKDQPVLQAALHDRCDVLLTGDRTHFGRLYGERIESLAVYSPGALADLIL